MLFARKAFLRVGGMSHVGGYLLWLLSGASGLLFSAAGIRTSVSNARSLGFSAAALKANIAIRFQTGIAAALLRAGLRLCGKFTRTCTCSAARVDRRAGERG